MVMMDFANALDFFEPIDEARISFGETVLGFFGSNWDITNMNCDVPPIKFWIDLKGVYVIYVVVIDVKRVLTILLDNISDYPASFSALTLPFLDVVAEVANHVLVNEGKFEFCDVGADGFELDYEMLEVEDVVVVKLTTISFDPLQDEGKSMDQLEVPTLTKLDMDLFTRENPRQASALL
ncbi:uncharacterized protein LAESUDRAFT_759640 [Laetiporus sulphureus 93-53]|uniref:Uncharacterized protein n=1 Tax=Laetiporus sulphureus 93-53 TaxID=1314785 RepID=A0A165E2B0_9APHY|nr:uncharacterized protein LAESUDRAFT_759640 [Laetiporus sulphureus 93-53]KZT06108.1 hypothetical protein LAESUDRAFT_759640 [Laetiporus sulphureus 93-53]